MTKRGQPFTSRLYKKPISNPKPNQISSRKRKAMKMTAETDTFDTMVREAEIIKAREDKINSVIMNISRPGDAQTLELYIKAPVLAEIVRKMAPGNYPKGEYVKLYHNMLVDYPWKELGKPKPTEPRVITRPAVQKITGNFKAGTDFDWDYPRACLLYNPDALAAGFTLTYKVDKPVAPDTLRKWGKMFMDGCNDLIANARPFKMSWVMDELPQPAAPRMPKAF